MYNTDMYKKRYTPMAPVMSRYFQENQPSAVRMAFELFMRRTDGVKIAYRTDIGNVSLKMHPAIQDRLFHLDAQGSPFAGGINRYTATSGEQETINAFKNVIAASGFNTEGIEGLVTDGSSLAMELLILGICEDNGRKPLLLIDPAYANYRKLAQRTQRRTVSLSRTLQEDGRWTFPEIAEFEKVIKKEKPGGLLVIPYDNPSGQFINHETLVAFARLCARNGLFLASDEAYRELHYNQQDPVSIWRLTEDEAPGITDIAISLETSSKTMNACGLRIGGLFSRNKKFIEKATYEYTANLCANAVGQYVYAGLGTTSHDQLRSWFTKQREYYQPTMKKLVVDFHQLLPGVIVSKPESSIYSVVDVRKITKIGFSAVDFVTYCAREGKVDHHGQTVTLLVAPMSEFYDVQPNPGDTQMRIAYVESPEIMAQVPFLFAKLLKQYEAKRSLKD